MRLGEEACLDLGAAPVAKVAEVQVAVAPLYAHFVDRIRAASFSVVIAAQNAGPGRSFHAVMRAVQVVVFAKAQVALESSEAVAHVSAGGTAKGEKNQLRWGGVAASLGGI